MSEEIRKFLLEFKQVVTSGSGVYLVRRKDTLLTMNYLGLTKQNVENILLGLSVTNYCRGPLPDQDRPGEIWEFGKDIDSYEIYIKLKVANVDSKKIAKCISFHIAKHRLKYPYS